MQYMTPVTISGATVLLEQNELVVIPTETVYGLAGLATSEEAVNKIFSFKERPQDNPLICHFSSIEHIQKYTTEIPRIAHRLFEAFSPGPLTILLPVKDDQLQAATRGQAKVACRIPNNQDTLELIETVNVPLAAPSANPSGRPSSTTSKMAHDYFLDKPGGILQSTPSTIGLESTILDIENNIITILREGSIGVSEILSVLPKATIYTTAQSDNTIPGQKYRHYSPETPIRRLFTLSELPRSSTVITTRDHQEKFPSNTNLIYIASTNNIEEIAKNLYEVLISIDKQCCEQAYWYVPDLDMSSSLGQALHNRLSKVLIGMR